MGIRTIDEIELKGKRVFIRVDFNVPQDEKNNITDDTRILFLFRRFGLSVRLVERPSSLLIWEGLRGKKDSKFSLAPVAGRLSQLLGKKVTLAIDCIGEEVQKQIGEMKEGEVLLLENLRFHPEEEKNEEAFSKALASSVTFMSTMRLGCPPCSCFDRRNDTICGSCSSRFFNDERGENLEKALVSPQKPYVAILGGAKVSDKMGVIQIFWVK